MSEDKYAGIEEFDLGIQDDGEPAVVTEAAPETTETEAAPKVETTEAEKPAEEEAKPEETKHNKPGSQRAREQRDQERALRMQAEKERDELKAKLAGAEAPADPNRPRLDQFEDLASYEKALESYTEKKTEARVRAQIIERNAKASLDKVTEVGRTKYEDFDDDLDAIRQAPLVSGIVAEALVESANAADLIHHFAEHLDELNRISQLSPVKAARELVALEAKYSAPPPPKQTSKAPPPVRPVSGGSAVVTDTRFGGIEEF